MAVLVKCSVPGDDIAQEGILVCDQRRLEGLLRLGVVGECGDHFEMLR